MKVKSHLDFEKSSQILNIKLHQVATLPSPAWAGGLVYLTSDNKVYYGSGTSWIPINSTAGLITGVTGGVGITVSVDGNGVAKVTVVPDNTTLEGASGSDGAAVRVKDSGISAAKLATDAVETLKIKNANVTAEKLATNSVETVKIKDANVTADKLATNSVTTIKVTDKNITFAKIQDIPTMTVIGRVAASSGVSSAITILTDLSGIIEAHNSVVSAKAVKDYVDGVVAGLGKLIGQFNASAATDFPSSPGGTKKGDYWYVSGAGTVRTVALNVGDVLIANKDAASVSTATDWIFLEVNRDQATTTVLGVVSLVTQAEARAMVNTTKALTPSNLADVKATDAETQTGTETARFLTPANLTARTATEARTGIAEIATQSEVNAGSDDSRIVTPAKLKVYVDNTVGTYGRYIANIGDGSATSIIVAHSMNTKDVKVEVWDNATFETVLCDVTRTSNTQVTLSFVTAPTSGQYRVFIQK